MKSFRETRYVIRSGSDGVARMYVEDSEVTIMKVRQGKKADVKSAIKLTNRLRGGIDDVLLEKYKND